MTIEKAKLKSKAQEKPVETVETVERDPRGRKTKEITLEDLQNKGKELLVLLEQYGKSKRAAGRNAMRVDRMARQLGQLIRTNLVD